MTSVSSPICNGCGEGPRGNSKLLICSHCSKAWYHDALCQRQHYPEHKSECRQIVMHPKFHQSQSDKILLSFTEGLQVIDSGGELGKVAIASCDFSPLDVVLLEPPAIVFDEENGYFSLFDAFLGASSEVKKGILQMENGGESVLADPVEYQGIMRDMLVDSEMRRYTLQNPSAARNLTGDLPKNLVRIVGINAHSFTPTNDSIANGSTGLGLLDKASALFIMGSKVEHSCAPNLRFCTYKGMLRYTAEIPISCGDRLSISYLKGTLHSPRHERQDFLQKSKKFLCKCSRCVGPDECSPLHCNKCKGGALFHAANSNKWFCSASCGWDISSPGGIACIQTQSITLDELAQDIAFFRESLQYGIEESTLAVVMDAQAKVVKIAHPLHWLHVAAWDLVSIVATSSARILMMEGLLPSAPKVAKLLRLSATCQIHQIFWTERNAAIVYDQLKLKDAVANIEARASYPLRVDFSEGTSEICNLIDLLCAPEQRPLHDCTEVSQTVFHAGQDILLADDPKLASQLYATYQNLFLVGTAPWVMGDKNKESFRALVQSGGLENLFDNHLLAP